jgi:hypothetical protein
MAPAILNRIAVFLPGREVVAVGLVVEDAGAGGLQQPPGRGGSRGANSAELFLDAPGDRPETLGDVIPVQRLVRF